MSGHYLDARRHVLQAKHQYEGQEPDDPEQPVAEGAASGDVGGPVARVDEAHCDDESGPQVAQEVAGEEQADVGGAGVGEAPRR